MIDFGNHGFYIALSYAVAFIVLLILALEPSWRARRLQQELQNFYRRQRLEQEAESEAAMSSSGPLSDLNGSVTTNREVL